MKGPGGILENLEKEELWETRENREETGFQESEVFGEEGENGDRLATLEPQAIWVSQASGAFQDCADTRDLLENLD